MSDFRVPPLIEGGSPPKFAKPREAQDDDKAMRTSVATARVREARKALRGTERDLAEALIQVERSKIALMNAQHELAFAENAQTLLQ